MTTLVTRVESELRPPRKRVEAKLNKPSTGHWNGPTLTVSGEKTWEHEKCFALVRGTQNFHMDGRGWSDIAYNFIVCPHSVIFEGRGLDVVNAGNGTKDGNRTSHAVMCLAGKENAFLDPEKSGFRDAVRYISENSSAPDEAIGHRDHKQTECPGDERYNWIHQGMPIDAPYPGQPIEDDMKTWLVRAPNGAVYVFNGLFLIPANNKIYRDILKWHGTEGDPWFQWSKEQIDSVPKMFAD